MRTGYKISQRKYKKVGVWREIAEFEKKKKQVTFKRNGF